MLMVNMLTKNLLPVLHERFVNTITRYYRYSIKKLFWKVSQN